MSSSEQLRKPEEHVFYSQFARSKKVLLIHNNVHKNQTTQLKSGQNQTLKIVDISNRIPFLLGHTGSKNSLNRSDLKPKLK